MIQKFNICGIPISEYHAKKLGRVMYDILTMYPIREQDKKTIEYLKKLLF